MNSDSSFQQFSFDGKVRSGKKLLDWFEHTVRLGHFSKHVAEKEFGCDMMWFLWCGRDSPLFGKSHMATFERYFISDKESHIEQRNSYFQFRDSVDCCSRILEEFDLSPEYGRIVNGHVPVKVKKGENPIKASGKLLVIDGGFAKAYQRETGIAGYTLISSSHDLVLAAHKPFESTKKAIEEEIDVIPERFVVERRMEVIRIRETDVGRELLLQIDNLKTLIEAFKQGFVRV